MRSDQNTMDTYWGDTQRALADAFATPFLERDRPDKRPAPACRRRAAGAGDNHADGVVSQIVNVASARGVQVEIGPRIGMAGREQAKSSPIMQGDTVELTRAAADGVVLGYPAPAAAAQPVAA